MKRVLSGFIVPRAVGLLSALSLFVFSLSYVESAEKALTKRLAIRAGLGWSVLSYTEKISGLVSIPGNDSDFRSAGLALEAGARLRIFDKLFLGADYQGSFIGRDTETWDNIGTVVDPADASAVLLVDQQNELKVTQHLIDVLAQYAWSPTSGVLIQPLIGWHWLRQDFTRSIFRFNVSDITFLNNLGPVSEDFRGSGPLIGVELSHWVYPRKDLAYSVELFGGTRFVQIINFTADNSLLGKVESDGWSSRWELGVAWNWDLFRLEVKYRGLFQRIDEASNSIGTLPENETWVQAYFFSAVMRF